MSRMFYDCEFLYSFPEIINCDTSNVYNMSLMFYFRESLTSLPDISK